MMYSLGLVASLAVAAQAIMIPPTVSLESTHIGSTHGALSLADPYTQILQVGCPGCMFAQSSEEGFTWIQGVENNLLLNISVGSQPETLELNGVRFYPPVFSLTTEPPVPYISQVPGGHSLTDIREHMKTLTTKPLRLTSWSFRAATSHTVNESGEEILTIVLQLNALERQSITVPDITITALKNTDAQLMLLKIEAVQGSKEPQECKDWPLLCKWRGIVADRLKGFKGFKGKGMGCHKRPHHSVNGPPRNMHHGPGSHHNGAGSMEHHNKPHHGMHGGHRHHHNKIHRILHMIGRVVLTVLVPVLIGIIAGMATYVVGMAIGALIAFVWMRFRRNGQYAPIALDEEYDEPRDSLEKAGFTDEEAVTAPPVYVEVEAKEVSKQ